MDYKLIGEPCGQHGPYTFYKAFKYTKNEKSNILALSEFFFVKLWSDSDLVSIGELQLLWEDKNTEQTLASLRLYILPENTPDGRNDCHGEDEVLAITEKVVLRVEDLLSWITDALDWSWGLTAVCNKECSEKKFENALRPQFLNDCTAIDLEDVDKEKDLLDESHWETNLGVVVLSYPRYCRYRGLLKRLEGVHNKWLRTALIVALGGFTVPCRNTRVLYCKDTFDYPDLEGHELLCNHLAPKLKGRPRKKRKKLSTSPEGSESESESSVSTSSSCTKTKISLPLDKSKNLLQPHSPRRSTRSAGSLHEKEFLAKLFAFMKNKHSPISRIPCIGFKEIDLYSFYNKVQHLGGYDAVTSGRLWKYVYEEMGGDQNSTSAATISRRHFERLLLPYERQFSNHSITNKCKRPTSPAASSSSSTSTGGTTVTANFSPSVTITSTVKINTSVSITPSVTITPNPPSTLIASQDKDKRTGGGLVGKPSSLRSIRLKPEKTLVEVGGKENIPVQNSSSVSKADLPHDFIDLCSEDSQSPSKASLPVPPSLKKQKLDILKEGGLEVTPITTSASTTSTNASSGGENCKTEEGRPSVIRHAIPEPTSTNRPNITITENNNAKISVVENNNKAKISVPEINRTQLNIPEVNRSKLPISDNNRGTISIPEIRAKIPAPDNRGKISITVTPDVSTMLTMPGYSAGGIVRSASQQRLPPPTAWTKRPVIYGNPKDLFQPPVKRSVAEEVLDLRMKSDDGKKVGNHPTMPCRQIGSNLEITLVPSGKSNPPTPPSNPAPQQRRRRPNLPQPPMAAHTLTNGYLEPHSKPFQQTLHQQHQQHPQQQQPPHIQQSPLIIPNVSLMANNQRKGAKKSTSLPPQVNFPSSPYHHAGYKGSPYLPVPLDPIYLSALFNGLMPSPTANSVYSQQQVQLYKELLRRQVAPSNSVPESFPRLLQDGSTSITLVANNSTPTSK